MFTVNRTEVRDVFTSRLKASSDANTPPRVVFQELATRPLFLPAHTPAPTEGERKALPAEETLANVTRQPGV